MSLQGITESINVLELKLSKKHVRPLDQQDAHESRKLWQNVTKALLEENYEQATLEKQKVFILSKKCIWANVYMFKHSLLCNFK